MMTFSTSTSSSKDRNGSTTSPVVSRRPNQRRPGKLFTVRYELIWIAAITFVIAASLFLAPQGPYKMELPGVGVMPQMSPFVSLTGLPGPTTGLTRSFVNTAHLRFGDAFQSHLLGPLTYAAMLILYGVMINRVRIVLRIGPDSIQKERSQSDRPDWLRRSLLPLGVLFLLAWVARLALGWY